MRFENVAGVKYLVKVGKQIMNRTNVPGRHALSLAVRGCVGRLLNGEVPEGVRIEGDDGSLVLIGMMVVPAAEKFDVNEVRACPQDNGMMTYLGIGNESDGYPERLLTPAEVFGLILEGVPVTFALNDPDDEWSHWETGVTHFRKI